MQIEQGMVAVVTGAGSGIGRALAERAASRGMKVVAADVEAPKLDATVDEIVRRGGEAIGVRTDVSVAADVERLADEAWSRFGGVNLLCNNAGVFSGGLLWERTLADWEWVMGVNLYGLVHAARTFVPRLLDGRRTGPHRQHRVDGRARHQRLLRAVLHVEVRGGRAHRVPGPRSGRHAARRSVCRCWCRAWWPPASPPRSATGPSGGSTGTAEPGADEEFVLAAMEDSIGGGMPPTEVAALVFDAVESERFWIPTKPSYHDQIRARHDDMQALRHPASAQLD